MSTDPRLQQLASEAARKIKALTEERNADIQRIYQDYQEKAAAIRAESSTDGIDQPPALPSVPQVHH
jgi:hypothetical protein